RSKPAGAVPAYQEGFIAFGSSSNGSVWTVVDADGTSNRHVVAPRIGRKIYAFRYSPDGRDIAVLAEGQLWAMAADTSNARKLADDAWSGPAWTPDGSSIVFGGSNAIKTVPLDGSRPPSAMFADDGCTDSAPQVTQRGFVFFHRTCDQGAASTLAVYRPGDAAPSDVSTHSLATVSPDGSRMLWLEQGSVINVASVGVFGTDAYQVEAPGRGAVAFDATGDVVIADRVESYCCNRSTFTAYSYRLSKIADYPHAATRTLAIGELGYDAPPIDVAQWVRGPSNLPVHPVVERIGGVDRVDTAVRASQWAYDDPTRPGRHATTAVLARSDTFPDALTGTALAIQAGGPLLLTPTGALDPAVGAELRRALAPGSTVYLLGGTAALGPAVADAVARLGFTPVRLGGADRYGTAAIVASAISGGHPKSVLLATGTAFPDALTAGVAAGQERYSVHNSGRAAGGVVLLTDGGVMPAATRAYLDGLSRVPGGTSVYAVGGPAARALDSAFPQWPGATKLVGVDRFDTAARVATSALFGRGVPGRSAVAGVATGLNFPDALAGGTLVGDQGGPLLLADAGGLTSPEQSAILTGRFTDVVVFGGPAAVSGPILTGIGNTAFGPNAWVAFVNRVAPPHL
ncbi:MAG: hypothetical protein HOW97_23115, partial [Catenulispora sp.]|nr:hypothetical protein [Catenulispora sp.]